MLKKTQPFFVVVILSACAALIGCHRGVASTSVLATSNSV
jgi:hypothetical protein